MALPACNQGATGSYRDITVNSLGNAGVYRHEPWLHRAALYVLRGEPGINRRLAGPGLYWGNVGKVRTQFIFMKCVPVHHGIPAVLHRDVLWLHLHSENGALVPVQPRETSPYITENLLMGRNESNQTSTSCAYLRLKTDSYFS